MRASDLTIAINGSMLDDHPTGVGVFTINITNYLSRLYQKDRDKMITVFTPSAALLDEDIRIRKIPSLVKSSSYGKLAALYRFLWNTFLYPFQAREYDIRISLTTHGSFFSKNQILTIHDLISLKYNNISAHQRFYFKYLLPYLVKKSKLILTVSESSKADIVTFLKCSPEKIKVVYNGYDSQRYNYKKEKLAKIKARYGVADYLLAVGPNYPHKNFETLLRTYQRFDDSFKKKHPLLVAGGKGKYLFTLKTLVKQLNMDEQVLFAGYVPSELMPSLYNEAFALIFPSLYEGFGIPLLEAMASGCPVIASTAASVKEVCNDAALYFDPNNTQQLFDAIGQLTQNKLVYDLLVNKGIERSELFTWEKSANTLNKIIENQTNHSVCLT